MLTKFTYHKIHYFKMYDSVIFCVFIKLSNQQSCLAPGHFHRHQTQNLYPSAVPSCSPVTPVPGNHFPSLWICLSWAFVKTAPYNIWSSVSSFFPLASFQGSSMLQHGSYFTVSLKIFHCRDRPYVVYPFLPRSRSFGSFILFGCYE